MQFRALLSTSVDNPQWPTPTSVDYLVTNTMHQSHISFPNLIVQIIAYIIQTIHMIRLAAKIDLILNDISMQMVFRALNGILSASNAIVRQSS